MLFVLFIVSTRTEDLIEKKKKSDAAFVSSLRLGQKWESYNRVLKREQLFTVIPHIPPNAIKL